MSKTKIEEADVITEDVNPKGLTKEQEAEMERQIAEYKKYSPYFNRKLNKIKLEKAILKKYRIKRNKRNKIAKKSRRVNR